MSRHGRARSASEPDQYEASSPSGQPGRPFSPFGLPRLTEEGPRPSLSELGGRTQTSMSLPTQNRLSAALETQEDTPEPEQRPRLSRGYRKVSRLFGHHGHGHGHGHGQSHGDSHDDQREQNRNSRQEYDQHLVDWLDAFDPEVQTMSTLTNIQNSLFVPDLGNWLNRRPTYVLSHNEVAQRKKQHDAEAAAAANVALPPTPAPTEQPLQASDASSGMLQAPPLNRTTTISSRLTESHYAALPHGTKLDGWTAEEKSELDDHVRHMLHSRRSKMKRSMKGFGRYVRRPLGFLVTLYATLITLFGTAWVLFLIGWIYVGDEQVYAIHVIDSVLVALFGVVGYGLAPFRIVDTYRMIYIARWTKKINDAKKGKPPRARLQKRSIPADVKGKSTSALTTPTPTYQAGQEDEPAATVKDAPPTAAENDPLTPRERKSLEHHQKKLARSHSFYKPGETQTHYAFPLGHLIAIVILLDCHSCLQIALGSCTWGIDYHTRPFALTTVILCVSITCNITAGLTIMIGDRQTRKKDVLKLMDRQELTEEAMNKVQEKREKTQRLGSDSSGSRSWTKLTKATRSESK